MAGSDDYPIIRPVPWVNIPLNSIVPGTGIIGIDLSMNGYNPCKHQDDPYYQACGIRGMCGGYYWCLEFHDGAVFDHGGKQPYGVFFDNSIKDQSGREYKHNWGAKLTRIDVEIYPSDMGDFGEGSVGGARFDVKDFNYSANGGQYSNSVGTITLPTYDKGAAKLNGFAFRNGQKAHINEMMIECFQDDNYAQSSDGYQIQGFAVTHCKDDGYYQSGPLYPGSYKLYVSDCQNQGQENLKYIFSTNIYRPYERLDFDLVAGQPPRLRPC